MAPTESRSGLRLSSRGIEIVAVRASNRAGADGGHEGCGALRYFRLIVPPFGSGSYVKGLYDEKSPA